MTRNNSDEISIDKNHKMICNKGSFFAKENHEIKNCRRKPQMWLKTFSSEILTQRSILNKYLIPYIEFMGAQSSNQFLMRIGIQTK